MIYLIISIIASVSVSILLKIAKKKKVNIAQAVAFNYPVAIILSFILLQPDFSNFQFSQQSWLFAGLGILLPLIFIIMGMAVQKAGIVKADIAQRLSLILTLMVAFFFWNEAFTTQKLIGVGLAFIALLFILNKKSKSKSKASSSWLYLLLVWLGYGVIDLMFKLISKTSDNAFSTTLTLAFSVATLIIFAYLFLKNTKFNQASIIGGIILGVLNFTNIYTYIKAHQFLNESPSLVFTGMNLGVIVLGTMVGTIVFDEKLNRYNYIGILLAALAILLLFLQF
ncbi:EamA family transporter [Weeksellaceae bacterium KMM 9724]|uniref:EamA family transporter n=1 Tax=Profundicola chukchiensis TaxID=2961959 RepID=UPI00243E6131|nr:EamA family transporter [Profundicola chukchiensis]MDG4949912.1 EamA family transporter [Profundicola chukchiensis]